MSDPASRVGARNRRAGSDAAQSSGSRRVALQVLERIDQDGAYANLVLGPVLERSGLSTTDKAFVTMLVYGTTRMRRACDALVDRFITKAPEANIRRILRLGAFQIAFGDVPPHAAVAETVSLAPVRTRGFVNAILRKVVDTPMIWAGDAERLSYPDWLFDRFVRELGSDDAMAAMETMNKPAPVSMRTDGYVQDRASQQIVDCVGARGNELVIDVCAGPGGKCTGLAATGAHVIGLDVNPVRAGLVRNNARSTGHAVVTLVADARCSPLTPGRADRVLVDAPCSGLGVLRRRADARWRVQPEDIEVLAHLQHEILQESAKLVRSGGVLVYSVCTLTARESIEHGTPPGFISVDTRGDGDLPALPDHWEQFGHGARLLPQTIDSDGMVVLRYRRTS